MTTGSREPTVGRIIRLQRHGQVHPGIITQVHGNGNVNAQIFWNGGKADFATSVPHADKKSSNYIGWVWGWPDELKTEGDEGYTPPQPAPDEPTPEPGTGTLTVEEVDRLEDALKPRSEGR